MMDQFFTVKGGKEYNSYGNKRRIFTASEKKECSDLMELHYMHRYKIRSELIARQRKFEQLSGGQLLFLKQMKVRDKSVHPFEWCKSKHL